MESSTAGGTKNIVFQLVRLENTPFDVFLHSKEPCPGCKKPMILIDQKETGEHVACVHCYRFWHLRPKQERVNCTCFLPVLSVGTPGSP